MPHPFIYHQITSHHIRSYHIISDHIISYHHTLHLPLSACLSRSPTIRRHSLLQGSRRTGLAYIPNGWGHHPSSPATLSQHTSNTPKNSSALFLEPPALSWSPKSGDFARLLGGNHMDLSECGVDRCHRVWCQGPYASWRGSPDYKPKPISAIFTFSTLGLVIPVSIILHHGIMKQWKPSNVAWANHCSYNSHHPTWLLLAVAGPHDNGATGVETWSHWWKPLQVSL